MDQLEAGLEELVEVSRAHLVPLTLDVLVVGRPEAHLERLEAGERAIDLATDVDATLLHVEAHWSFLFVLALFVLALFVLTLFVLAMFVAAREAILGVEATDRRAEEPSVAEEIGRPGAYALTLDV